MGEQRSNNRWNWEVTGFEPRKASSTTSLEHEDHRAGASLVRRYSISSASSLPHSSEFSKQAIASKVQRLKDKVKVNRFLSELL